ncbi:acyltransferase family protein [Nitrobacter sp. JJSN]|uniref:acyltransferase family protein n=1 Tax=Nitrobacter sp. JJSN TaxID=3453033 RepID=UPI003F77051F
MHKNNFDLVRLLAALNVAAVHLVQHGIITSQALATAINTVWQVWPGVPVFFVVSGFLIAGSWQKNSNWSRYLIARACRILPGLFVSTCVVIGLLWAFGYLQHTTWETNLKWFFGTVSTLYVYHTPHQWRAFSGDMPNASIWTLPIEMQFYAMLPVTLKIYQRRPRLGLTIIGLLMLLSALMLLFHDFGIVLKHPDPRHTALHSFLWFGLGVIAQLQWQRAVPWLRGTLGPWLAAHVALCLVLAATNTPDHIIAVLTAPTLAAVTLSAAHTLPGLSQRLLRGNDFSYGAYLYHRPFIHAVTGVGLTGWIGFAATAALTASGSVLSWALVERPFLTLKTTRPRC